MLRRRYGDEDERGTSSPHWMVTYSDMVTLLLCFFVLLFSFSSINLEKFRMIMSSLRGSLGVLSGGETVSQVKGINNAPMDIDTFLEKARLEMEMLSALYDQMQDMFAEAGLEGQIELHLEERGLVVRFADNVLFDVGQAHITSAGREALSKLAVILRRVDNQIRVEGHTDNWPIHNERFPSNWELSTARATNVLRLLITLGISPERLSAAGYGEYRPIDTNDTAAGRQRNRRVDIVILRSTAKWQEPSVLPGQASE